MAEHKHRWVRHEEVVRDSKGFLEEILVRPSCSCGDTLPEESYNPDGTRNY